MNLVTTAALRGLLGILLLGALLVQVLIPLAASEMGTDYPEVAHLVVPYSVLAVVAIAVVEVALVSVWRLLAMVASGTIFTPRALGGVDVIAACVGLDTALALGVLIHVLAVVRLGGPGTVLALTGCVALGLALGLLMIVMRGLLGLAISDRVELAQVI